ncbi:MAG: hypothetical protein IJM75_09465 [Ruminococcus sp.]|nr:hypothetical protein [Ruminococcus sp.]
MNEKNLFDAVNNVDERFILEAAPAQTKHIRLSRKAVALCAAAVIAVTGTVSAVAVYGGKIGKSAKNLTNSTPGEKDIENIEKTTLPFSGEVLCESFEDIDFTVDGITRTQTDRGELWLTAKKTNGERFECPDDEYYVLAYTLDLNAEGLTLDMSDERNVYYNGVLAMNRCEINDDGTLSVMLDISMWDEDMSEVYLGLGDIIRLKRDDYYTMGEDVEKILDAMIENGAHYPDEADVYSAVINREYYSELDSRKARYAEYAEYYEKVYTSVSRDTYKGKLVLRAELTDNIVKIPPEQNNFDGYITITALGLDMKLPAEKFIKALGSPEPEKTKWEVYHTYKDPTVTLTLESGEKLTLTATLETWDNSYVEDYATIVGDIHESGAAAHLYAEFESTADPFKVIKIQVGSVTVWKK